MFNSIIPRIKLARDIALSLIGVAFGRLLPTLKPPPADLSNKIAIVTGGNSGIGLEIALGMAKRGCTVYLACRSSSKAEAAVSQITSHVPASEGRVHSSILDTSSFDSVRSFASTWKSLNLKIDFLFHNAGIGHQQGDQKYSTDGFPIIYATNFLGPFLLTHLLEPCLSSTARIIMTSSFGNYGSDFSDDFSLRSLKTDGEPGFHVGISDNSVRGGTPYYHTKAMQIIFAKILQDRFDRQGAENGTNDRKMTHSFNPGFVKTHILDLLVKPKFRVNPPTWVVFNTMDTIAIDASQGAATGIWLACSNDDAVIGKGSGGGYWDRMSRRASNVDVMSRDQKDRFWVRWEADAGVQWR